MSNSSFPIVKNSISYILVEAGKKTKNIENPRFQYDQSKQGGLQGRGNALFGDFKKILKGIEINEVVYLIYFLYVGNTCISYLLCHRRILLYADIREYICKRIDIMVNITFAIIGFISIFTTRDIMLYIVTLLLQTFVSNLLIHIKSKKIYPYLKKGPIDKRILRNTLKNTRELLWGTVAGFVFASTDNIIVSSVLGTVYVGYLGNYSLVSKSVQSIVSRVLSSITPTIGRLQHENLKREAFDNIFLKYHQICYLSALAVTVPQLVLFDGFINWTFGKEYLIDSSVKYFLAYICYVCIAAFAYGNILTTSGEFKRLKQVEMIGAVMNIVTSLALVNVMELSGVLAGTAVTVTVQWLIRSYAVYTSNLSFGKKAWMFSILKEIYKILIAVLGYICAWCLYNALAMPFTAKFVICGFLSVAIVVIIYMCMYRFKDRLTMSSAFSLIKNRRD